MNQTRNRQTEFSAPLVSVIVPLYNHARFVLPALQSVLDQTYRPVELIVIDDGSTDGSATLADEFLKGLGPVPGIDVSFVARDNKGAAATINEGIQKSRGEYIAILNSDDLYAPSRLQECLHALTSNKARLLFTYVQPIDETGAELPYDHSWRQWYYDLLMQELDNSPSISFILITHNIAVSTGNLVFHRSVIADIGLFASYRYAHDLDFLLRYSLMEEPAILRRPLYRYRVHASNTIAGNQDLVTGEAAAIVRNYLARCLSGACRNPVAPSFDNWPGSLNDALHGASAVLRSAIDGLLEQPLPPSPRPAEVSAVRAADVPATDEITVVTHELSRTGAPMLVLEVARALKELGVCVNVISMRQGPLREEFANSGIPVKTLEDRGIAGWLANLGRLFHRAQRIPALLARVFPTWSGRVPGISPGLARLLAGIGDLLVWTASMITLPRLAADVRGALVINSFASFPLAFQLLYRWKGRAFWYIHETYDPQILLRSGAARKRLDELYRSRRIQLLFGSEATRAAWSQYGFDGQVRYWSGLSTRTAEPGDRPPPARDRPAVILSVGTNETRKGTRWLLEAFACARSRGWISPDVELVIVGCRPPSKHAQARDLLVRAGKSDLRGCVHLVPSVSPEALHRYYAMADLYVQSSIMECLPLTLLMAMAHLLPIVTTDVDGCKEAIQHEESGLLVPSRRIEPLASAIAELLNDRAKACSFGSKAGEKFATTFSLEATIGPLAAVLLNAELGGARRGRTPAHLERLPR